MTADAEQHAHPPSPAVAAGTALRFGPEEHRRAGAHLGRVLAGPSADSSTSGLVPVLDREILQELLEEGFPRSGVGVDGFFEDLHRRVLPQSTAVAHPRFLAYVLGPPNDLGPYAEAVAASLNQNCNFWQLSPAANVIEQAVVRWLGDLFGLRADLGAGGILTPGGSMATLDALSAALHRARPEFRRCGLQDGGRPLVLYTSEQAHRCVDKAAAVLGLGLDNVRRVPVDGRYRMRTDVLARMVREDRSEGREPFCVVATAGTVTTGSIDPVPEVADICEREGLWLHVDGAYGALFVLAEQTAGAFEGCSRADSIALDPHKLLFAPLEAGALLVRDAGALRAAFAFSSSYLTVSDDPLLIDYMDHGPQLSRGFAAFKVWAALRTFGTDVHRAVVGRQLELAALMGELVDREDGLELMAPVTLSAVCLRVRGLSDDEHTVLLAELATEGTALLGPATVDGRSAIRACINNHRTTADDIALVVRRLADAARSTEVGR